jgi:hypothetical protein
MGKLDGRCMCGSITYSCDADPVATAVCHCTECQRQTGTAFSVVVGLPVDALKVEGDTLAMFKTVGEAQDSETERNFCSACGSPIFSLSSALPDLVWLKAGTLDDTSWLEPQVEVWGRSAQPWVEQAEGRPRVETVPGA